MNAPWCPRGTRRVDVRNENVRAETPADGLSAAGKRSASPGSFYIRVYPTHPSGQSKFLQVLGNEHWAREMLFHLVHPT